MKYHSTRGRAPIVDFRGAMLAGLASDGGLYVPAETPRLPVGWQAWDYVESVTRVLELYGAGPVHDLVASAAERFSHREVAPVVEVGDRLVYELFWGPTLSFKDHALQVVARLLEREVVDETTVLGATSGDTGSAAIEACRGRAGLRVVILFPEGKVSEFQRRQMTTVADDNVIAIAVRGDFDDCQALVKDALVRHGGLLAANSINWARVAAQVGYYVYLGGRIGEGFDVVVPTGNFGNVLASWLAKQMGVSIETITIANNANHLLADLVAGREVGRPPVVPTLAPAMDIAVPSNLERFTGDLSAEFRAGHADDGDILDTIGEVHRRHGYLLDPHSASAWRVGEESHPDRPQVVVATAHPAKFAEAVERATGQRPQPPEGFADLFQKPEKSIVIDPEPSALDPLLR